MMWQVDYAFRTGAIWVIVLDPASGRHVVRQMEGINASLGALLDDARAQLGGDPELIETDNGFGPIRTALYGQALERGIPLRRRPHQMGHHPLAAEAVLRRFLDRRPA